MAPATPATPTMKTTVPTAKIQPRKRSSSFMEALSPGRHAEPAAFVKNTQGAYHQPACSSRAIGRGRFGKTSASSPGFMVKLRPGHVPKASVRRPGSGGSGKPRGEEGLHRV